jgi:membrane protein YdbS with pleckstrin-like domain
MFFPFPRFERDTLGGSLETVVLLLLAVTLTPGTAAVGADVTVSGTAGRAVVLVLALLVAGLVVHRRWRDAVS